MGTRASARLDVVGGGGGSGAGVDEFVVGVVTVDVSIFTWLPTDGAVVAFVAATVETNVTGVTFLAAADAFIGQIFIVWINLWIDFITFSENFAIDFSWLE